MSSIFHKIQAVNIAGTVSVLLITVFGFLTNRPEFLDLALVYGLLNVIGTFSVLKFFKFGRLGEEDNKKEKRIKKVIKIRKKNPLKTVVGAR